MKRLAVALLLAGCADGGGDLDPTGAPSGWSVGLGDVGDDEPLALAVSDAGEVLVLARFEGQLDVGGGPLDAVAGSDLLLAQFGPDGEHRWSRAVDQTGAEVVLARAQADGDGWLVGGAFFGRRFDLGGTPIDAPLRNVAFAARLGPDGGVDWQLALPASGDSFVNDLAPDGAGGAWLAGRFLGEIDAAGTSTSALDEDIFVARISGAGAVETLRRYGGPGLDTVTALAPRAAGGVWLAGLFDGTTTLGERRLVSAGERDPYLVGLAADGTIAELSVFGGPGDETLSQVAIAANGDLLLAGGLSGALDLGGGPLSAPSVRDVFVARLTPGLEHLFSRRFSGPDFDTVRGIAGTDDDRIFVAGTFRASLEVGGLALTSAGDSDGFVVELDGLGDTVGALAFGAAGGEEVVADVRSAGDSVVLLGGVEGEADLGFGPVLSAGGFDLLVAKLSSLR